MTHDRDQPAATPFEIVDRLHGELVTVEHQVRVSLGLNFSEHAALEHIRRRGPSFMKDAAYVTGLSRAAMTSVADRLMSLGLATVEGDRADRRRKLLIATDTYLKMRDERIHLLETEIEHVAASTDNWELFVQTANSLADRARRCANQIEHNERDTRALDDSARDRRSSLYHPERTRDPES